MIKDDTIYEVKGSELKQLASDVAESVQKATVKKMYDLIRDEKSEELITVEEAAASVKMHPNSIYKRVRSGNLPFQRKGRKILITRKDLMEAI